LFSRRRAIEDDFGCFVFASGWLGIERVVGHAVKANELEISVVEIGSHLARLYFGVVQ
jgi:hypothetical protein